MNKDRDIAIGLTVAGIAVGAIGSVEASENKTINDTALENINNAQKSGVVIDQQELNAREEDINLVNPELDGFDRESGTGDDLPNVLDTEPATPSPDAPTAVELLTIRVVDGTNVGDLLDNERDEIVALLTNIHARGVAQESDGIALDFSEGNLAVLEFTTDTYVVSSQSQQTFISMRRTGENEDTFIARQHPTQTVIERSGVANLQLIVENSENGVVLYTDGTDTYEFNFAEYEKAVDSGADVSFGEYFKKMATAELELSNYDRALSNLAPQYLFRVDLPEGDPNKLTYSESLGGFVNSDGEVWRGEVTRGTNDIRIENAWAVETARETLQLIDSNGNPFTWTITLERLADYGYGPTNEANATFTDEFRVNLANFASLYLDGSTLDGDTLHITYVPFYEQATTPQALESYLQERSASGPRYEAFGFNETQDASFARIYNAAAAGRVQTTPRSGETQIQVGESYTSVALSMVFIMIANSQTTDVRDVAELLPVNSRFTNMVLAINPRPSSLTGNFATSTKLVHFN